MLFLLLQRNYGLCLNHLYKCNAHKFYYSFIITAFTWIHLKCICCFETMAAIALEMVAWPDLQQLTV